MVHQHGKPDHRKMEAREKRCGEPPTADLRNRLGRTGPSAPSHDPAGHTATERGLAAIKRDGPSPHIGSGSTQRIFNPNLSVQPQRPATTVPPARHRHVQVFLASNFKMTHDSVWYSRPRK